MGGKNKYPEIELAIETLKGLGCDFAFFHEAALAVWGISYSSFINNIDVLVSRPIGEACDGEAYTSIQLSKNITLRSWLDSDVIGDAFQKHDIWSETYECRVLDPELVLELLPLSPNFQELYEARARLAMVLYHDKMTEEELREFSQYVRGI